MVATALAKELSLEQRMYILSQQQILTSSLGMKDSWGPLKALAAASAVNGIGDMVLCIFLGYGIAGAAWATMASQIVAAYMMIAALNKKGYNAFALATPSLDELLSILGIAAPVFVMIMSKVAFYVLLIYFATSMGTITTAAHQVLLQTYIMCSVCGEPLSQTAQSFMPALIYGVNRSLAKARVLFKSLVLIGVIVGAFLGLIGTGVLWCFPHWFTTDQSVVQKKKPNGAYIHFFYAQEAFQDHIIHILICTVWAGRDLKFISATMSGCFTLGALLVMFLSRKGFGLPGCWFALTGFQWTRFFLALRRLTAPNSIINAEDVSHFQLEKLRAV